MDFFEVVFEVLILELFTVLDVLVHTRENVGNELSILVVIQKVKQGGTKPFMFLIIVYFPVVALFGSSSARTSTAITVTMIPTKMLVLVPKVPIILAFMLPIRRPMRVIRPTMIIAAGLVVRVVFLVLLTIVLPAASVTIRPTMIIAAGLVVLVVYLVLLAVELPAATVTIAMINAPSLVI